MTDSDKFAGLTSRQAEERLKTYGPNEITEAKKETLLKKILGIITEPMFLLLIIASVIYFILGEARDGVIMLVFVVGVISIDIFQELKTDKTLEALRELSAPRITVMRDGQEKDIPSAELVPGDIMIICEGVKIPADGAIIKCSDLCVDESALTGEAEGVWKNETSKSAADDKYWRTDRCYAGTLVTQGSAVVEVEKTAMLTEYAKIAQSVAAAPEEPTPLQKQTSALVKVCAVIAAVLFVLVGVITFFNIPDHILKDRIVESILSGVTLAMAMIPEEFPVILSVFLALGAGRLAKKNSLVRKLPSVETLGAVSVLCVDKTGTITMNQMSVEDIWARNNDEDMFCETMGLACETQTYDPMEKAMLLCCENKSINTDHIFGGEFLREYPFTNETKMMGHVWLHDGEIIIAAKGSPEKIFTLCNLSEDEKYEAEKIMRAMSEKGLRVIAVGRSALACPDDIPDSLSDCSLELLGLVGLYDPPRENVKHDIARCTEAGIRVVMITGDNGITAASIARQTGIAESEEIITGDMIEKMTDEELCEAVKHTNIFARVIPGHKMRIVKAFKANGEIVAMTGDGVNDAPALKYADIGIAMGGRGSEVSRQAADLILLDDNFSTIVDTVADGRRIFDNIKKAVGYVFAIHIPIALSSLVAPMLGIDPSELLLLPLHVVLLELIIDPTCSVVLERQPAENDVMSRPPRDPQAKILDMGLLIKSVTQGLLIFAASFGSYYALLLSGQGAPIARSVGLTVIIASNIFLVAVNSSSREFALTSVKKLSRDKLMWLADIAVIAMLCIIIYSPLNGFLKLSALSFTRFGGAFAISAASVLWYETVKLIKKVKK